MRIRRGGAPVRQCPVRTGPCVVVLAPCPAAQFAANCLSLATLPAAPDAATALGIAHHAAAWSLRNGCLCWLLSFG